MHFQSLTYIHKFTQFEFTKFHFSCCLQTSEQRCNFILFVKNYSIFWFCHPINWIWFSTIDWKAFDQQFRKFYPQWRLWGMYPHCMFLIHCTRNMNRQETIFIIPRKMLDFSSCSFYSSDVFTNSNLAFKLNDSPITTSTVTIFRSIDWWLAFRVFTATNISVFSSVTPEFPI